jgi:hypothetical protein
LIIRIGLGHCVDAIDEEIDLRDLEAKSSSSSERILSCSPSIRSSQEEFSVKRLSAIRKAMRCDLVR